MLPDEYLHMAFRFWEQARKYADENKILLANRSYTRGLGSFLSYVKLTDLLELTPAYYAYAELAKENTRLMADTAKREAVRNARVALVTSHIADPSQGKLSQIGQAVRDGHGPPLYQLTVGPRGPLLTPETRIAGAAEARDLLASVLEKGAPSRGARKLWPIGSGPRLGAGPKDYWQEQKRYMRAVLPSCAGLSELGESERLRGEAAAIYAELRRVAPEFDAGRYSERNAR